jgi:3'-phosphoadenosine 5'-phosphosulfate (PAPS) 3'-phosphatase
LVANPPALPVVDTPTADRVQQALDPQLLVQQQQQQLELQAQQQKQQLEAEAAAVVGATNAHANQQNHHHNNHKGQQHSTPDEIKYIKKH